MILLLVIPFILDLPNFYGQFLYIIVSITVIAFLGIAALLTFIINSESKYYRIIRFLLRSGMFLIFAAMILAYF